MSSQAQTLITPAAGLFLLSTNAASKRRDPSGGRMERRSIIAEKDGECHLSTEVKTLASSRLV